MNIKQLLFPILTVSVLFTACESAPEADSAATGEEQEVATTKGNDYSVNLNESTIEWVGTKPVGKHHGTVKIQDGNLLIAENGITGGKYVMDMTTIQPDDQDEKGNTKLGGHLKSDDFFQVEKYPTATFEITSVSGDVEQSDDLVMKDATHMITGNLTMKGITKSITFPAKVDVQDNKVVADANFNIDRTEWDIVYRNDKSLGDNFIRPEINLDVHLVADNKM